MNSIATWCGAIGAVALTAIYPQESVAEKFTGSDFLAWNDDNQRGYISAQLGMASSISARIKPSMSQCIADAFYGENGVSEDSFSAIFQRIQEFAEYHPSSVLVVIIENKCGEFN